MKGTYLGRGALVALGARFGVPVVREVSLAATTTPTVDAPPAPAPAPAAAVTDVSQAQSSVRGWVGREGAVLSLGRGAALGMYKLKSHWYVSLAAASKAAARRACTKNATLTSSKA